MVDKCEIKVPKSRNYLTEWPFVRWPYVRVAFSPDPVQTWRRYKAACVLLC